MTRYHINLRLFFMQTPSFCQDVLRVPPPGAGLSRSLECLVLRVAVFIGAVHDILIHIQRLCMPTGRTHRRTLTGHHRGHIIEPGIAPMSAGPLVCELLRFIVQRLDGPWGLAARRTLRSDPQQFRQKFLRDIVHRRAGKFRREWAQAPLPPLGRQRRHAPPPPPGAPWARARRHSPPPPRSAWHTARRSGCRFVSWSAPFCQTPPGVALLSSLQNRHPVETAL